MGVQTIKKCRVMQDRSQIMDRKKAIGQVLGQAIGQAIGQGIGQAIRQGIGRATGQVTGQLISQIIDQVIDKALDKVLDLILGHVGSMEVDMQRKRSKNIASIRRWIRKRIKVWCIA